MEKEEVSIESPATIEGVTIIPVARVLLNYRESNGSTSFFGVKQPIAVVVVSPSAKKAFKITGEEVVGVSNKDVDDLVVFISSYTDEKIIKITDITVEVVSSAGNKVLVFGEVGNEGLYLYKGTITVLEAIAMAGGIRTTGKRESIIVVSGNMTDNPQARRINLFRILRKGTPKTDIVLTPNDVIYVPRTFIADVNRFYADIQPTLDQGMSIFDWRDAARAWYRHTIPE